MTYIITIAKKEFRGYFNTPLAYTMTVPFLLLSIFLFIQSALVSGEATLRPYFELLPWFLLFLAPALSMKLFSDEYTKETLELLFAHPVSELQIVLGKFFGVLTAYTVILLTTLTLPLTLVIFSRPDIGQIAGQYLGAILIGMVFLAGGLAASTYTRGAITSFLLGASVSFILIICGMDFVTQAIPYPVNAFFSQLSVLPHNDTVSRGLVDIRDVFYFFTMTAFFLILAILKISEVKTTENKRLQWNIRFALILTVAIALLSNILLSYYPIRIDLTAQKLFTLSDGTKQTVRNVPDIVTVTLYRSRQLPSQMELVARDIRDMLKDYAKLSGNLTTRIRVTDTDPDAAGEARNAGIQEVQFNSIGSGKFEVQTGILGIGIRYGDKTETIPFVSDSSDLEYQLTRRIRKLTDTTNRTIGLIQTGYNPTQILNDLLSTQYEVKTVPETEMPDPDSYKALIVIDEGSSVATASSAFASYIERGGSALVLANGVSIDQQSLGVTKSESPIIQTLKSFGVTINQDLVYDLQLAETLAFTGEGGGRYLAQYPYWLRALPADSGFPPAQTVKSVSLGWPSSISITNTDGVTHTTVLTTGNIAGKNENAYSVTPDSVSGLEPNDKNIPLAVYLEKNTGRALVVSSTTLVSDQFLQNNQDDGAFVSNVIDYLASDKDLAAIPNKTSGRPVFELSSPIDIYLIQWGNLIVPPLAVMLYAIVHLRRRRKGMSRIYVK